MKSGLTLNNLSVPSSRFSRLLTVSMHRSNRNTFFFLETPVEFSRENFTYSFNYSIDIEDMLCNKCFDGIDISRFEISSTLEYMNIGHFSDNIIELFRNIL